MPSANARLTDDEVRTLIGLLDSASAVMKKLSEHPKLVEKPLHHRLRYRRGARELADAGTLVRGLVFKLTEGEPIVT
jgi:hypothetical protein